MYIASPPITKSRSARRADHRHVAGAVAGGVGEADRAVAEEVEGAAEAGVGVDRRRGRSRPCGSRRRSRSGRGGSRCSSGLRAVGGRLPLGLADDEGRAGELGDRRGVVEVQVGHHHDRDLARVEAALAQLRGDVFAGLEGRLAEAGAERAEVLLRVGGDRGVQAGVDEDRAGARVADQEGRAPGPRSRLAGAAAPAAASAVMKRPPGLTIISRAKSTWPATSGSTVTVAPRRAAGERLVQGLWLRRGRSSRRPIYAARLAYRLRRRWLKATHSRVFRDGLLEGQVCVVSGAGSGLGRETALELARLGATVVACGRREEPLAETAGAGRRAAGSVRVRGARHPRGGAGRPLLRRPARAPRPPRRPRQQRRRPVPQPGRGDHRRKASAR